MNAISAQVIPFPSCEQAGMRHQVLVLGNTARRTLTVMDELEQACDGLEALTEDGGGLCGDADQLHADLAGIMAQIDRCIQLMREISTL